MAKYYVTFGTAHCHHINGVTVGPNHALAVEAEDYGKARQRVFDAIGSKWAFMYGPEDNFDIERWCPAGIVDL